jgi:antitoxin (DNA-binding transcriptional repressor) of toxin-antitoxin stability system
MNSVATDDLAALGLLTDLEEKGVKLWLEGDSLRYRAGAGVVTAERKQRLQTLKSHVVTLLRERPEAAAGEDIWPPSDSQLGMTLDPTLGTCECIMHWRCRFDPDALNAAVRALTQRHSVLRTKYRQDAAGKMWAITQPDIVVPVRTVDLRQSDAGTQTAEIHKAVTAVARSPIDLATGPMLEGIVLWLADEEILVLFGIHHSVFDVGSHAIFRSELRALYDEKCSGVPANLPPLRMQFSDYARQHQAWLAGEGCVPQFEYWKSKLAGADEIFYLPHDRRSDPGEVRLVPHIRAELADTSAIAALRELAKQERTTMFAVAATMFHMALARWGGRSDTLSWIMHLGRSRPDLLSLIGCFSNHWLLRPDLSGNPSFLEALRRVRAAHEEALPNLGITVFKLIPLTNRIRNGRYLPSIALNYLAIDDSDDDSPAVRLTQQSRAAVPLGGLEKTSPFSLNVSVRDYGSSMRWSIQYSSFLFEEQTVQRAANAIISGLQVAAHHPQMRLAELEAMPISTA